MISSLPFLVTAFIFLFFSYLTINKVRGIKETRAHLIFLLITLATFFWQSLQFLMQLLEGPFLHLALKLSYLSIMSLPILFFHFVSAVRYKANKIVLYGGYVITLIFQIVLLTSNKIIDGYYHYSWGIHQRAGDWHFLFIIFTVLYVLIILFILFRHYKRSGILERRKQYIYVFFSAIFFAASSVDFIPNYGFSVYPFGFLFLLVFVGLMFFAISKYNLLSISSMLSRSLVVFVLSVFSYLLWIVIFSLEMEYISPILSEEVIIMNVFLIPFYVYIFIELYKKIRKISQKVFEHFDKHRHLREFLLEISEKSTPQEAREYVLKKIPLILKSDPAFVLKQKDQYELITGVDFSAKLDSRELENFYLRERKMTTVEELNLKSILPDSKNSIVRELMNENNIAVIMRLRDKNNKDNTILLLQKKRDGKRFFQEELEFLLEVGKIIGQKV